MDEIRDGRAFVGVRLDGQVNRQLGVYQRSVYDRFKGDDRTVRNLPRRLMTLPIFDLGRHDEEAFEIIRLAIRRGMVEMKELQIVLGRVEHSSDNDTHYISAAVTDGLEPLVALRESMAEQFRQYGFAFCDAPWTPHVPMTRINGAIDPNELPPLECSVSVRIRGISIFGPKPTSSTPDVIAHRISIPFEQPPTTDDAHPNESSILEEIGEQLDERITQLNAAFATQRRRLKPKLETPDDDGGTRDSADEMTEEA